HLNFENPPRPQNSWIIFRKDYQANLSLCNPNVKQNVKHMAQVCSLKWRQLSSEVKHFFKILEKIARENHKHTYPNYKYEPKNVKNAKNSNCRKFILWGQKKRPVDSMLPPLINNYTESVQFARTDIVSTTSSNTPMINANSALPSTINDDSSLLINTDEINNDN
ncbi:8307_t:CDS:1, partial [Ambispora gerdemannii]